MVFHKENYEEYILDYLEGNLPAKEGKAMEVFLANHPDIQDEINDLILFQLEPKQVKFINKNELKRSTQLFPIRWVMIAASIVFIAMAVITVRFQLQNNVSNDTTISSNETQPEVVEQNQPQQQNLETAQTQSESVDDSFDKRRDAETAVKPKQRKKPSRINHQPKQTQVFIAETINHDTIEKQITHQEVTQDTNTAVISTYVAENKMVEVPKNSTMEIEEDTNVNNIGDLPSSQNTLVAQSSESEIKTNQPIEDVEDVEVVIADANNEEDENDGFTIETFPSNSSASNLDATLPTFDEQKEKQNGYSSTFTLTDDAKKDLKNALIPKAFGFIKKKDKDEKE